MTSDVNVTGETADDKEDNRTLRAFAIKNSNALQESLEGTGREEDSEEALVETIHESSDAYITHTYEGLGLEEEYEDCIVDDEVFSMLLEESRPNQAGKSEIIRGLRERGLEESKQAVQKVETEQEGIEEIEEVEGVVEVEKEQKEIGLLASVGLNEIKEEERGIFEEKENSMNIQVKQEGNSVLEKAENGFNLGREEMIGEMSKERVRSRSELGLEKPGPRSRSRARSRSRSRVRSRSRTRSRSRSRPGSRSKVKENEMDIDKGKLGEESLEGSVGETMIREGTSGENQTCGISNVSAVPHIFAFKKPKLKSASINREFLNKAPIAPVTNVIKTSGMPMEKGGAIFARRGSFLQASTSTTAQTNPGKPRLTTKISSPAPYSLGGHQESVTMKSLNGKSVAPKTSGLGQNSAPVWGRNKKPLVREYTDEELSSMHGIHLVHRLSATSDDDKPGKWDEMDDDETDWSDTIEFADGTKFTLPHEDHTASSVQVESNVESEGQIVTPTSHTEPAEQTEPTESVESTVRTPTETLETTETTVSQETCDKHISKEERFGEEHYDRTWNSQRSVVPQIYNVNTGKFDIVDDSTKNGSRRAGRRASTENKARVGYNISLLSRHRASTQLRKEETIETYESKPYKPLSIIGNESRRRSQGLSEDSDISSRNLPQHSATTMGLTSTVKSSLSHFTQPYDPMIEDIETYQRAIMTEAKEKARLRREEEEMERKMQQERAKKKAEELAKLAQKPKLPETTPSKENDTSTNAPVSSQQQQQQQQQESITPDPNDSKTIGKPKERKKDLFNSSHSHTKTTITQTHKVIPKPNQPEMNMNESRSSETNVDNTSESTLKKEPLTIPSEPLSHSEKNEESLEANKQTPIDSKQKYSKSLHTSNQSNINDNWRKEHTNIPEKNPDKTCTSLDNTPTLEESKDSSDTPLFSSEKKESEPSTANNDSNKSSPSHSRTSSRFFPTAIQTELEQSDNHSKTEETDSPAPESLEKQNILPSKESSNTTDQSTQTDCSNTKPHASPQSPQTSQTAPTQPLRRLSNTKTASTTSTIPPTSPTAPSIHLESNGSNSTRNSTRPSTRSFDDVMEQLARAGNFAQNNEKFASYLSNSKTQKNYIDGLSVTTISPLEFEKYPKSAINVSLHSLNHSNESFNMSSLSIIDENDTKPFVNLPASSHTHTERQSPKNPKYFEPSQHTIDITLYDEQEIDTLRLYLPETSPRNIKIKPSSTFLYKKLQKSKQTSIYNS